MLVLEFFFKKRKGKKGKKAATIALTTKYHSTLPKFTFTFTSIRIITTTKLDHCVLNANVV